MIDLQKMTAEELAREIAGPDTIAGGGSISALAGAYGAALMSMVSRKTIQNKKYEAVREEFTAMLEKVQEPRETFLRGIQGDIDAFGAVEEALALPKNTDEEKAARKEAMNRGMIVAAEAPLHMAELAVECLRDYVTIVGKGNSNAWSDALAGVLMMRSAVLGSVYNVRINLNALSDREECRKMLDRATELEAEAIRLEAEIMELAPELTKAI